MYTFTPVTAKARPRRHSDWPCGRCAPGRASMSGSSATKIERLFNGSDPAFGRIRIEQLGRGCFIGKDPELADAEAARKGWARCADLLRSGEYDVVILDELTIALHFGLLSTAVVLDVLRSRHPAVEVVITGRYAPQALIDAADLVTEMCDVKHYYTQGVLSRDGIDR